MYTKTLNLSLILALIVVVLGAYTRLADAGLGCPDWPGCYGQLLVPDVVSDEYEKPLDTAKAWKEMVHRYAASTLGLSIIVIFLFAAFRKTERKHNEPSVCSSRASSNCRVFCCMSSITAYMPNS